MAFRALGADVYDDQLTEMHKCDQEVFIFASLTEALC